MRAENKTEQIRVVPLGDRGPKTLHCGPRVPVKPQNIIPSAEGQKYILNPHLAGSDLDRVEAKWYRLMECSIQNSRTYITENRSYHMVHN